MSNNINIKNPKIHKGINTIKEINPIVETKKAANNLRPNTINFKKIIRLFFLRRFILSLILVKGILCM